MKSLDNVMKLSKKVFSNLLYALVLTLVIDLGLIVDHILIHS